MTGSKTELEMTTYILPTDTLQTAETNGDLNSTITGTTNILTTFGYDQSKYDNTSPNKKSMYIILSISLILSVLMLIIVGIYKRRIQIKNCICYRIVDMGCTLHPGDCSGTYHGLHAVKKNHPAISTFT